MTSTTEPRFDELLDLNTQSLRQVLQSSRWIDKEMLPGAVAGSSEAVQAKLFVAMTTTICEEVEEQLATWAAQPGIDVQARDRQHRLVEIAEQLTKEGRISFGGV